MEEVIMLSLSNKKNVLVNVTIDGANELEVLRVLAERTASLMAVDEQELRSGLLASAATNTDRIAAGRVLITHASATEIEEPAAILMTLSSPVQWQSAEAAVDYACVIVMPVSAGDSNYEELADKADAVFNTHAAELSGSIDNSSKLSQIIKEII